ncbi:GNAT family N-acetyltransferase [Levilactobacillus parabrevis]|uniref:GNAT family N-acetyltransferase n=1 Tax=Levilactobacillus parabrevis TaxID=357278 RepID=UPI0021A80BE0|nr:GNAT family N-acetyltransferase [Levilactobacillus parabrevis]MCT4487329.1 GNAT family N-acetyltransferase [Levilactobacillus parabrevis]MCT4490063.1 GNAT family N-acetyltransferase [Levilactobacillus parabrevis]
MKNTTITSVTPADLEQLRNISVETFTATFGAVNTPENLKAYLEHDLSREQLGQELADPTATFYFLQVDNELAGYGKLLRHAADIEIQRVYVREGFQHHGLGRQFLEFTEQVAREAGLPKVILGVWEHNDNALAFYKFMGYHRYGAHTFKLGDDPQTDYLMEKDL